MPKTETSGYLFDAQYARSLLRDLSKSRAARLAKQATKTVFRPKQYGKVAAKVAGKSLGKRALGFLGGPVLTTAIAAADIGEAAYQGAKAIKAHREAQDYAKRMAKKYDPKTFVTPKARKKKSQGGM